MSSKKKKNISDFSYFRVFIVVVSITLVHNNVFDITLCIIINFLFFFNNYPFSYNTGCVFFSNGLVDLLRTNKLLTLFLNGKIIDFIVFIK